MNPRTDLLPVEQTDIDAAVAREQEIGAAFGTPIGESIIEYAAEVRKIVSLHKRLLRVANAAQAFCAELCEDSPDVPQPQLMELHAALERYEARLAHTPETQIGRDGLVEREPPTEDLLRCVRKALAAIPADPQRARLVEALTPSPATKAAYIGEFSFCIDEQGDSMCEVTRTVDVPWTTIKEIMAAIRARALAELPPESE